MVAAYNKKTAVVVLDPSEVRLIMKALDELRYSDASRSMTGSQLVNLAGLSMEWLSMTQGIGSPDPDRITDERNNDKVMDKLAELYGEGASREVY